MDADKAADLYAEVAAQGIARIREDGMADFDRWLYNAMRDVAAARGRPNDMPAVSDWMALAKFAMAAADPETPYRRATAWMWARVETRRAITADALDPKRRKEAA